MNSNPSGSPDARKIALEILNMLDDGSMTLNQAMESRTRSTTLHSPKDRALLNELVYGVLRRRARLDHVIGHFSNIKLSKLDPSVLNIFRLGLYQFMYLSRIPVSAAVNTSVEMSKTGNPPWVTKFVNAVLRKASREHANVPLPSLKKDPISAITIRESFPLWLVERWVRRFGHEQTLVMCRWFNAIPSMSIRANSLKVSRETLRKALADVSGEIKPAEFSPEGIIAKKFHLPVSVLPGFKSGWFQVQDEAAQLVSYFLGPKPGEHILDACAGLGGKTGHLAQLMNNRGRILAVDRKGQKLKELNTQMNRLGIRMVRTKKMDLLVPIQEKELDRFDRILVDAPCSGLGVINRNPDTKWKSFKKNLTGYAKTQVKLLENVSYLLKPGGIMVYAVCSMEPEENERVVEDFLKSRPNFSKDPNTGLLPETARTLIDSNGFFKTIPWKHHMDGFFAARFRKHTGK